VSLASWAATLGERVAPIMAQSGERVQDGVKAITPVLTGRMREHTRMQPTSGGYGYFVGWVAEDFRAVGQPFYPFYVLRGTKAVKADPARGVKGRKARAGRDLLTPPLEAERPRLLEALRKGLVR